jgi:hypothetical protein
MQETPQSQPIQTPTQQQYRLPILKIHGSTRTNRIPSVTKWAKWTYQHLENAMDGAKRGHTYLQKATTY